MSKRSVKRIVCGCVFLGVAGFFLLILVFDLKNGIFVGYPGPRTEQLVPYGKKALFVELWNALGPSLGFASAVTHTKGVEVSREAFQEKDIVTVWYRIWGKEVEFWGVDSAGDVFKYTALPAPGYSRYTKIKKVVVDDNRTAMITYGKRYFDAIFLPLVFAVIVGVCIVFGISCLRPKASSEKD